MEDNSSIKSNINIMIKNLDNQLSGLKHLEAFDVISNEPQAAKNLRMKLSIIIVNWNTKNLLSDCIASVYDRALGDDFELIVVDNDSSDGSQVMIRTQFPEVNLITNSNNPGFAKANNQALRICSGENILLLNPDTIVKPGAIETLVKFIDENPEAGAVGARLLNPDGSLQRSAYPKPTLFREFWRLFHLDKLMHLGKYPMNRWNLDQAMEVDILKGACILIRREALDDAGLLDEEYFMYSEDLDLCTRLTNAGWRLYWIPNAEVIHFGGQSTKQVPEEMFLRLYEGKIMYFRKHQSNTAGRGYKLILYLASIARLALTPLTIFEKSSKRSVHRDLSHNYRQLLFALPNL